MIRALALMGTHYIDIRLRYETLFGPPGAGPVILSSRAGVGDDSLTTGATREQLLTKFICLFY